MAQTIQNNRPRSTREMSDKQRRWWFAQQGGRGGGGSAPQPKIYGPNDPIPSPFREAVRGFFEGLRGGSSIAADKLTFGLSDLIGITDADQYASDSDYDFSRGSAALGAGILHSIGAGKAIGALGRAFQATSPGAKTANLLAAAQKSRLGKFMPAATAAGAFTGKYQIDKARINNPAMDPNTDKTLAIFSTALGYVGTSSALKGVGQVMGAFGRAIGKTKLGMGKIKKVIPDPDNPAMDMTLPQQATLADRAKQALKGADWLGGKLKDAALGGIKYMTPKKLRPLVKRAYAAYEKTADFTGASISEITALPKAPAKMARAGILRREADEAVEQGDKIFAAAAKKGEKQIKDLWQKVQEGKITRGTFKKQVDRLAAQGERSAINAQKLYDSAQRGYDSAATLESQVIEGAQKAGYIASLMKAKNEIDTHGLKIGPWDYKGIEDYRDMRMDAMRRGELFELPIDKPRGKLGTFLAAVTGTLGNPIEKQMRAGHKRSRASYGSYLAELDAIKIATDRGALMSDEEVAAWRAEKPKGRANKIPKNSAEMARIKAANYKPYDMEGKALYTGGSAFNVFGNWKSGDLFSRAIRTGYDTIDPNHPDAVHDGDTVVTTDAGRIRVQGINTPELVGAKGRTTDEMLGPEARDSAQELLAPGQRVLVVRDSNPGARTPDKYGRSMAEVRAVPETLRPLFDVAGPLGRAMMTGATKDLGEKMIEEGLADIHYRHLSGRTDSAQRYDAIREAAKAAGIGIWSPEAQADPELSEWVGKEKTVAERQQQSWERAMGEGTERPDNPLQDKMNFWGSGLMLTGNSGIARQLPASGNPLIKVWNAAMAVYGAKDYNYRAQQKYPVKIKNPWYFKSDPEIAADAYFDDLWKDK